MKRSSDIVYVASDNPHLKTKFSLNPDFNFHHRTLPKLVDYSFHDDSDDEDDSRGRSSDAVEDLHTELTALVVRLSNTTHAPSSERGIQRQAFSCRNLRERASLKLKLEEDEERQRKERVMTQLNDALSETRQICDSQRPTKKRKVDMSSVWERFISRKSCRLLRGQGSLRPKRKAEGSSIKPKCLLRLLKKHK